MSGISKSQVSRLCEEIDEKVKAFLTRPIEGDWPYLWIDATYVKVRQNGRIVSVAVIIAVGVNSDGRREVLGMDVGLLRGRAVLDRHSCASSPAAVCAGSNWSSPTPMRASRPPSPRCCSATWQRCRVHFMRNVLAHAGRQGRRVVSAFIATGLRARRCRGRQNPVAQGRRSAASQACQSSPPSWMRPRRMCSPT